MKKKVDIRAEVTRWMEQAEHACGAARRRWFAREMRSISEGRYRPIVDPDEKTPDFWEGKIRAYKEVLELLG